MGTLGGHLLPGTFFAVIAIWWSFVTAIRYVQSRMKSPYRKGARVGYISTVTMPCIFLPCAGWRRAPVESYVKLILGLLGILGEVVTGFHYHSEPRIMYDKIFSSNVQSHGEGGHSHGHGGGGGGESGGMDMHSHHKRDVHAAGMAGAMSSMHGVSIPNVPVTYWDIAYVNIQHITMYSTFVIGAFIEILMHYKVDIPARLDQAFGILAFGIEAFLFANHLHSRDPLDIHVHTLLVYTIYGCIIFACFEAYNPNQILFTYGRIMFTLLQGTWFWEVGFILYPPSDSAAWKWDAYDHDQIMTITASYCWHIIAIAFAFLLQLIIIEKCYSRCWDELIDIDEVAYRQFVSSLGPASEHLLPSDMKFVPVVNSEDEDERVEFDQAKYQVNGGSMKMNNFSSFNGGTNSPNSNSSSSSGHFSAHTNI